MTTVTKDEAKKQLKQRRGGEFTLTPEVAKLIIAAGGPTFKTVSGGFRCNQTGEKVGRGGTEKYRKRVHGLAAPPKPAVTKTNTSSNSVSRTAQSHIPVVDITNPASSISCPNPHCRSWIGFARNMVEGVTACSDCNKQLRVIRRIVRADNAIRTRPSPTGRINCPHCYENIGHVINFSDFYETIKCRHCGEALIVE